MKEGYTNELIGGYANLQSNKSSKNSLKRTNSSSNKNTKITTSSKSKDSLSNKNTKRTSSSKSKDSSYNMWLDMYMKDSLLNIKKKDIKDKYMKIYGVSKLGVTKHTNVEGKKKFLEGVKKNNGKNLFNFMKKK